MNATPGEGLYGLFFISGVRGPVVAAEKNNVTTLSTTS
jgi:hypothetical protein